MTSYADYDQAVGPLSEAQEDELASELMEVGSEDELDHFLGGLFHTIGNIGKGVGKFLRSPAGHALGGILKKVAKKALPIVGGALGSAVEPGVGTAIGTKLGSLASSLFEMELGEMPEEEMEFEISRRLVRLMAAAALDAAQAPRRPGVSPQAVAWEAVLHAAHEHAPGLYRQLTQRPGLPAGAGAGSGESEEEMERSGGFGGRRPRGRTPRRREHEHQHHHRGFRERHPRPEYVYDAPVYDEPFVEAPVVAEPILQQWDPIDGPDAEANLEVGGMPGQASSGTWERQGRRIILRGV